VSLQAELAHPGDDLLDLFFRGVGLRYDNHFFVAE
jgi:hypothetical protein